MANKKGWVSGRWELLIAVKIRRLIAIVEELKCLRCGYFDVVVCLVGYYRDLSERVDDGRLKFDDCADVLLDIEDLFDSDHVARCIDANKHRFKVEDFYFMKARGLVSDDLSG